VARDEEIEARLEFRRGQGLDALYELIIELLTLTTLILRSRELKIHRQQPVGLESEVHLSKAHEALDHETGADQQDPVGNSRAIIDQTIAAGQSGSTKKLITFTTTTTYVGSNVITVPTIGGSMDVPVPEGYGTPQVIVEVHAEIAAEHRAIYFVLETADSFHQVMKVSQQGRVLQPLRMRLRGENRRIGTRHRNRLRDHRSSRHDDAIDDRQVSGDHRVAPQHAVFAYPRAPGNSRAPGYGGVGADVAVVADLDLVVQFHALFYHRVVQRAAVDGGAGADFHVVADYNTADLRDFQPIILSKPYDFAFENTQACGATVELFAALEQGLVADTDSKKWAARGNKVPGGSQKRLLLESLHAIIERAYARKYDGRGARHFLWPLSDTHLCAHSQQGLVDASQVPRPIIKQRNHQFQKIEAQVRTLKPKVIGVQKKARRELLPAGLLTYV